jgi:hypothetical protein
MDKVQKQDSSKCGRHVTYAGLHEAQFEGFNTNVLRKQDQVRVNLIMTAWQLKHVLKLRYSNTAVMLYRLMYWALVVFLCNK